MCVCVCVCGGGLFAVWLLRYKSVLAQLCTTLASRYTGCRCLTPSLCSSVLSLSCVIPQTILCHSPTHLVSFPNLSCVIPQPILCHSLNPSCVIPQPILCVCVSVRSEIVHLSARLSESVSFCFCLLVCPSVGISPFVRFYFCHVTVAERDRRGSLTGGWTD